MSTTTRQTLCLFETLPTEILTQILMGLTNLTDLDSVLHASPTVYRVFDHYAVEITQTILEADCVYQGWGKLRRMRKSGDTHPHIRVLILLTVLLRSSRLPIKNLKNFRSAVAFATSPILDTNRVQDHPTWLGKPKPQGVRRGFNPDPIPPDTLPAIIRSVLAASRRITWLSLDCLHFYLARFRPLRPAHPAEGEKSFDKKKYWLEPCSTRPSWSRYEHSYLLEPWNSKPPCRWPKPADLGPPTWEEEQRVSRALWHLQLFGDAEKAAARSRLDWPAEDIESFRQTDLKSMMSVNIYWDTVQVLDYLQEAHGKSRLGDVHIPWERLQARQREGPAPRHKRWLCRQLLEVSIGAQVHSLSDRLALGDFEPYRRLGFGLWCFERMRLAGFLSSMNHYHFTAYGAFTYHCAWLSILGPEDIAKVAEIRREAAENGRPEFTNELEP